MIIYDYKGAVILDVEVDDTSVRYKAIKGENSLTLKFSLAEHVEIPIGSYSIFKNEYYYLMSPESFTMKHRRNFEYNIVMYSEEEKAKRYKFVNTVDGRLKFTLTAKPQEHLDMFIRNMNMRENSDVWQIGICPDQVEVVLSYNHMFCHDALVQLADTLEMDYWFEYRGGLKFVHIGKLEINKDNPLPLSYGGDGLGLKADIKRANYTDGLPVDVLYVQGSEKNIDASKYGSSELHLPKGHKLAYDGVYFDNEESFDQSNARTYIASENGLSISRFDKSNDLHSEDSIECSEIYPTKEEVVENVIEVSAEKHFYDLLFMSDVDYNQYVIAGERATVIFQSGMLAGKEFDIATDESGNLMCKQEGEYWRMEIIPQDIDGITMPDAESGFVPNAGGSKDKFKVFNVQLPSEYIANNSTKTGAEWDLFRHAVKHMYANEEPQYTITGTLDEIYAKRNWENIEGRLNVGNYVSFSDRSFQEEPVLIRIVGIKEYVNKPHSPVIDFSNQSIGSTLVGTINRVENESAYNDEMFRQNKSFTKRSFKAAEETLKMIANSFDGFSESIDPVTIKTMAALFGDESLQFIFTRSRNSLVPIGSPLSYDVETKRMSGIAASLIHMTLNIDDFTSKSARSAEDYMSWDIPSWESAVLDNGDVSYYVYVMAPKDNTLSAEYMLSREPKVMEPKDEDCYYFLVGILNSESNGSREFVTLFGFTEILPGQITTDVIRSTDGQTYFDLLNGVISGRITFRTSAGTDKSMSDFADEQENNFSKIDKTIQQVQDQIDGVVENWSGYGAPTLNNEPYISWNTDADKIAHINDTYINIEAYVDDETTPTAGHAWRWCQCTDSSITDYITVTDKDGNTYRLHWHEIADSDAVRALKEAAEAARKADNANRRVSDLEYLSKTFAKGETIVDGGVVMTQVVAVGEDSDSVSAILNGSDFASDAEHGKLILAGGIEDTDEDLEERVRDASTRVYEDGTIASRKMILEDGCQIGDLVINRGNIGIGDGCAENIGEHVDNVSLNRFGVSAGKYYTSDSQCENPSMAWVSPDGIEAYHTERYYTMGGTQNVAPIRGSAPSGRVAYDCASGMFAGLRPKTMVISRGGSSSDRIELTDLDFSVLINMTYGTCYITLPESPQDGQEYWIETKGADIDLTSSKPMWSHWNGKTVYSHAFTDRGVIRFKYYEAADQWTYTWVEYH